MTTTIQFVNGKKGIEKAFIKNATLMYVKVKKASPIYDQKDLPKHAQTMFEYSVDLVVDEDTADQFDEQFPKQSAKKLLKAAFMKQYKIEKDEDFPASLDPKSKKFFVLKVRQNTHYLDKKEKVVKALSADTRPRAVAVIDGKKKDITLTTEVGNGSIGDVLLAVNNHPTYGASAKLKGILVTNLIEYVSSGGGNADLTDFFGEDVELAELPETPETTSTGVQGDADEIEAEDFESPFEEELEEDDF